VSGPVIDRPIRAIAAALRDGSATIETLIEEAVARHERLDGALGGYKHWDAERAGAEARAAGMLLGTGHDAGPLMGLPVSIKDIYGVRGMPTFAGTPTELPPEWRAEGPVVTALRQAMAVVMGKTHTVEFALGAVGLTANWETPRNPWDGASHRVCGGSSAGAGVSLAEGSAVVAMGTDTGGSVRVPASATGQVGLKTTAGRWSTDGIVPLSATFDTPGPLTRSVEDAAVAFAVIDPAPGDVDALFRRLETMDVGELRLGVCDEHFWDDCAPGIAEGVGTALDELGGKGARVVRMAFPEAAEAGRRALHLQPFGVEGLSFIAEDYPDRLETMDPNVRARFDVARGVSAVDYFTAMRTLRTLGAAAGERLRGVDALVVPTMPIPPPTVDEVATGDAYSRVQAALTRNTVPANLLGLCALTMPVALDGVGMPVGFQLIARAGHEERLLAAGLACEKVLGTGRERIGVPPRCGG
jgi:aspartyl-tRNA(Asn)/glutamyl-tRNA(Gln) amidotransferase subunit A